MTQQEETFEALSEASAPGETPRPIILMFLLVLLALFSPFAAVLGSGAVKTVGIIGVIVTGIATLSILFLPPRFGFRVRDFFSVLIVFICAAASAPNFIRDAEMDTADAPAHARALADALRQQAMQYGVDALPAFFASQLDSPELMIESDREHERIYQIRGDAYDYTLTIRRRDGSEQAEFTFTALAAPESAMDSFFMDANGKIITFSSQVIP